MIEVIKAELYPIRQQGSASPSDGGDILNGALPR